VRANGLTKGDSEATPQFGLMVKEVAEVNHDLVVMNGLAGCPLHASELIFTLGWIGMRIT